MQIIIAFQGFDVCDEGFSLTFYQQIFDNPNNVEYNFVYWLSGVFGGLWYRLYEQGGILWFRILYIIVNASTLIVSYNILKHFINKRIALIGLTMVVFINDFGFLVFYHNHLTALIVLLSIYFLQKGIIKRHYLSLLIGGILIGINVFSRLPNITLFILILAIPFSNYLNNKPIASAIKPMLIMTLGLLLGLIIVFIGLFGLEHFEIFKNAVLTIVSLGETKNSTHGLMYLMQTYIYNYKMLAIQFCKLLIVFVFVLGFSNYFKKNTLVNRLIFSAGLIILILFFKSGGIYIIYALGFIGVCGVLVSKNQIVSIRVLAFMALLIMLFLPLGSSGGIYDIGYICVWLAIPLFLYFISQLNNVSSSFKTIQGLFLNLSKHSIKYLLLIIVFSYFIAKVYNIFHGAYFDSGSRLEKTYKINNKYAQRIYTTKERADIINNLLASLKNYVKPGDYLLAYDNIPMVHFLTETKPYMYNPWVWIYDENSFEEKIMKAEQEINEFPIVVQQKFNTIGEFSQPIADYMSENKENSFLYNKRRMIIMNKFLKRNDYKIVWSNPYFNIYESNKNKPN